MPINVKLSCWENWRKEIKVSVCCAYNNLTVKRLIFKHDYFDATEACTDKN